MAPPPITSDAPVRVWLAFWFAALFWGTSFLWIKLGLESWNPVSLVAFRLGFACLLFLLALRLTRTPLKFPKTHWWVFPVVGLLNPCLPFLLISWAEQELETGVVSILNGTVPLFTLIIAPLLLSDERPTWRTCLGTAVGFVGIAVLFSGKLEGGFYGGDNFAKLAVLLACLLYSTSAVLLRRFTPAIPPLSQAAWLNGFACGFVWLQALATDSLRLPPATVNWIAVVWLGALGSFGAYSLGMYVMLKRGATQLGLINFAYPLLGMLLGVVVLGEAFQWNLLLGGSLILGGIALVKVIK